MIFFLFLDLRWSVPQNCQKRWSELTIVFMFLKNCDLCKSSYFCIKMTFSKWWIIHLDLSFQKCLFYDIFFTETVAFHFSQKRAFYDNFCHTYESCCHSKFFIFCRRIILRQLLICFSNNKQELNKQIHESARDKKLMKPCFQFMRTKQIWHPR